MSTVAEAPASGGFLDKIEKLGNKVPNPTIMFLYLIGFIALLSAALAAANVSVTDEVVTQVPKSELQTINEALGGMIVPWDQTTQEEVILPDYITSEVDIPVRLRGPIGCSSTRIRRRRSSTVTTRPRTLTMPRTWRGARGTCAGWAAESCSIGCEIGPRCWSWVRRSYGP